MHVQDAVDGAGRGPRTCSRSSRLTRRSARQLLALPPSLPTSLPPYLPPDLPVGLSTYRLSLTDRDAVISHDGHRPLSTPTSASTSLSLFLSRRRSANSTGNKNYYRYPGIASTTTRASHRREPGATGYASPRTSTTPRGSSRAHRWAALTGTNAVTARRFSESARGASARVVTSRLDCGEGAHVQLTE